MSDKLSVIIPVYNEERYLSVCLDSIIGQTYDNLEIIVVNDGSVDGSAEICKKYADYDKRISVIEQSNLGMINARYTGVRHSSGEYVVFCDGDDFVDTEAYEFLIKRAKEYSADIVTSGCYRYYGKEHKVKDVCARVEEGFYSKERIRKDIVPVMLWESKQDTWAIDPSLCYKLIKKEVLLKQYQRLKEYNFSFGEDSAVVFPAILEINNIYISHRCFYYHRQREQDHPAEYIADKKFPDQLLNVYHYLENAFENYPTLSDELLPQLDMFYARSAQFIKKRYPQRKEEIRKQKVWMFPFQSVPKGSRIVLYGAGRVGICLWNQLQSQNYCSEVFWVDQNSTLENPLVHQIREIEMGKYDYVVIGIESSDICNQVKQQLVKDGWNKDRIIISDFERLCIYVWI